jgi:hypothetical protein
MSKVTSRLRTLKKAAEKVVHGNKIQAIIPSGMASAGPPLGPTLGQVNLDSCHKIELRPFLIFLCISKRSIW